jgi:hypothetical protein
MDPNTTPQSAAEPQKSFKDTFGYEPLTKEGMSYWVAAKAFHWFFPWDKICSVAIARGHSLSEDEVKALIQVDQLPEAGDQCQFPNCTRRVTAIKGELTNLTTGETVLDRDQKPVERGSYLVLVRRDDATGALVAEVKLYCSEHAQYARGRGQGEKPLPLQSFAAATAKAEAMNAGFEQKQADRRLFDQQMGRTNRPRRPSGPYRGHERELPRHSTPRW